MATRLNDFSTGHKIVIMQRLHETDLTGDLLAKGGYEHLCLPAEFEPGRRCTTAIHWADPRQDVGDLLWPEKVSRADPGRPKAYARILSLCRAIRSSLLPRMGAAYSNGAGFSFGVQPIGNCHRCKRGCRMVK